MPRTCTPAASGLPGGASGYKTRGCSACSRGERQLDTESCSATNLRSKVYRTVVKLHNSESARKPDATSARPRCKEKLKHFLPVLGWNSFSRVAHGNLRHFAAPAQCELQLPAVRHCFHGVQHQVEHRLSQQIAVH